MENTKRGPFDLVLKPGAHVLAVDAFNMAETTGGNTAGVILGLSINFADGSILKIPSDDNWRVVPATERSWLSLKHARSHWPQAKVIGQVGTSPWWRTPLRIERVPPEQPVILHFWQTGWFQITLVAVCGTAMLVCLRLMAQLALQSKAQRFLQVERARIARDIHDDLGARLTQLVLLGEVAQSELPDRFGDAGARSASFAKGPATCRTRVDEVVWASIPGATRCAIYDLRLQIRAMFSSARPHSLPAGRGSELPAIAFDLPIRRNLFLAVKEAP